MLSRLCRLGGVSLYPDKGASPSSICCQLPLCEGLTSFLILHTPQMFLLKKKVLIKSCHTEVFEGYIPGTIFPWRSSISSYKCQKTRLLSSLLFTTHHPKYKLKKLNSVAFSPQTNYTDRATAACRRS
jgi:hypothetical protein